MGSSSWGVSEPRAGMFPDEDVFEELPVCNWKLLSSFIQEYLNYQVNLVVEVLFIRKVRVWRNDQDWS